MSIACSLYLRSICALQLSHERRKNVTVIYLHSSEVTFLTDQTNEPFSSPPAGATTLLDVRTMCYFFLASVSLIPCQANVLHSYSVSPSKATRCLLNQESVIGQVSVKTADVQCVLILKSAGGVSRPVNSNSMSPDTVRLVVKPNRQDG